MALLPNSMNFSTGTTTQLKGGLGMNALLSNLLDAIGQNGESSPPTPSSASATAASASAAASFGSERHGATSPTFIPARRYDCGDILSSNMLAHAMAKIDELSLSESPQTSSSQGSLSCAKCDNGAATPGLDCRDCSPLLFRGAALVAAAPPPPPAPPKDFQCDVHCEQLRYYCESCDAIVCQECTLWDHKDHACHPLQEAVEARRARLRKSLDSGKIGTKFIKQSIDRAVAISRAVERDSAEIAIKIRKAMRHFALAVEERERQLLEKVGEMRQLKLNELSDQMRGLRNALAGLVHTNESLAKTLELDGVEVLLAKDAAEAQIELFASMYKSLQPKDEGFAFVPPNFQLIVDLKKQGDVVSSAKLPAASLTTPAIKRPTPAAFAPMKTSLAPMSVLPPSGATSASSNGTKKSAGQCIPGSALPVFAKSNRGQIAGSPLLSFGTDGHDDGQLSRPWGLCVDRDGNIVVADRRNNRVQIFAPDGTFKLKFGTKGTGHGEFDLPAGITTDPHGRIVVVDKDNHRVQMFTAHGGFVLTFGMYGKGCGQFRYPWDVAINSDRQIVVTDSRNYRIQLFNSEGAFVTMLTFDGTNHSRMLKGLTTPRGVCFTPLGDIIISDFENHRLLLIDATLTTILGAKGSEGLAVGEFSRPSGVICDDEGKIVVADSKNQRVICFSPALDFLWALEVKGTGPDDNDRPTDVGLTQQGNLVVVVEGLPDSREGNTAGKTFIQIF